VIHTLTDLHAPVCAVAIGASAGGVPALRTIFAALPATLQAAVFVVLHLDPNGRSLLPALLAAVPDRHLLIAEGRLRLAVSAPVHHARPSIDRLFESVALTWLAGAVGVVLTGNGSDGASGIAAIKHGGGCTIAQDPTDAEFPSMPRAAIATGFVDSVLPLAAIGPAVARAVAAASGRAA
jgi:two-component system chemotaxis response regulator CheB